MENLKSETAEFGLSLISEFLILICFSSIKENKWYSDQKLGLPEYEYAYC